MDNTTPVSRWLALVRLGTGAVFVYMGSGHLLGGVASAEGFQKLIGGFARTDPLQLYTSVMVPIVLSVPSVFSALFVFGMIATGLTLAFGLFTRAALLAGIWFSLNNLLMGFGAGGVHHSINSLMLVLEIGFLWTGAWRPYSLDSLLFAAGARPTLRRAAV